MEKIFNTAKNSTRQKSDKVAKLPTDYVKRDCSPPAPADRPPLLRCPDDPNAEVQRHLTKKYILQDTQSIPAFLLSLCRGKSMLLQMETPRFLIVEKCINEDDSLVSRNFEIASFFTVDVSSTICTSVGLGR